MVLSLIYFTFVFFLFFIGHLSCFVFKINRRWNFITTVWQTGDEIIYTIFTTENNFVAICLLCDALKLFCFLGRDSFLNSYFI